MGINIVRWLMDGRYRASKKWKRRQGDQTLKVEFALCPQSLVFDVGAYTGEYAAEIARRYGSRVEAFEAVRSHALVAREALASFPSVHVHAFGLSDRNHFAEMSVDGTASSAFLDGGEREIVEFRDIAAILAETRATDIALTKINIEGGEYVLLPHLIKTGTISNFKNLLVQFHLLNDGDTEKYNAIAHGLGKTHRLEWRFPFVWELWARKD